MSHNQPLRLHREGKVDLNRLAQSLLRNPLSAGSFLLAWILVLIAPALPYISEHYLGSAYCDMNIAYRHYLTFAKRWLVAGVMPQWNPHIFCGTPFLPSTCATLHHPLNLAALYLLPLPLAANVIIMAHVFLFTLGARWWAIKLGLRPAFALFAAMVAAASSILPARVFAGHFTIVSTFSSVPWFLGALQVALQRGRGWVLPGVWGALLFLGGHLQIAYYTFLLGTGLTFAWLVIAKRSEAATTWQRSLSGFFTVVSIAAVLAAIELLPASDVLRDSARVAAPDIQWTRRFSLPPENLLLLLFPNALGLPLEYMGRWFWWEVSPFFGVVPLILTLVFALRQLREASVPLLFPSIVFIASLILACSATLPLVDRLVTAIPGWSALRGHAKIFSFAVLSAALLSGASLQALHDNKNTFRILAIVATCGAVAASLLLTGIFDDLVIRYVTSESVVRDRLFGPDPSAPEGRAILRSALSRAGTHSLLACGFTVLLALAARQLKQQLSIVGLATVALLELMYFTRPVISAHFKPSDPNDFNNVAAYLNAEASPARVELLPHGLVNAAMSWGLQTPGGNDVNISRAYNTFLSAVDGHFGGEPHLHVNVAQRSPLWDLAGLRYLVIPKKQSVTPNSEIEPVRDVGEYRIWQRKTALPYAHRVSNVSWVQENEEAIFSALLNPEFLNRCHSTALLVGPPRELPDDKASSSTSMHISRKDPHTIVVDNAPSGVLIVSEGYSRHWSAHDAQGRKLPVYRANSAFLAIAVAEPTSVILNFHNPYVPWGRRVTFAGLLAIIFLCLLPRLPVKRALCGDRVAPHVPKE